MRAVCLFQGAFWGLMSGFVVGLFRMVLDFVYMFDAPKCWETEDTRPTIIAKVGRAVLSLQKMVMLVAGSVSLFYAKASNHCMEAFIVYFFKL